MGPIPTVVVTSRHLRSGEDLDAALHVEFVAAVGIDVVPDQRGDGVPVAWQIILKVTLESRARVRQG